MESVPVPGVIVTVLIALAKTVSPPQLVDPGPPLTLYCNRPALTSMTRLSLAFVPAAAAWWVTGLYANV